MCDLKPRLNLICLVVPIDSTAISLQQCQPRKKGKLIRRHQRRNRLKGNRSSYNNLRLKSTGGIGVTPDRNRAPTQLRRSGSFPNRTVIYNGNLQPVSWPIQFSGSKIECDWIHSLWIIRRFINHNTRRTNKSGQISPRISPIPINPFDLVNVWFMNHNSFFRSSNSPKTADGVSSSVSFRIFT